MSEPKIVYQVEMVVCLHPNHWYSTIIKIPDEEVTSQDLAIDVFNKAVKMWRDKNQMAQVAHIFQLKITKIEDLS